MIRLLAGTAMVIAVGCGPAVSRVASPTTPTLGDAETAPPSETAASASVAEQALPPSPDASPSSISLQPMTWTEVEDLIAKQTGKVVVLDVWSTSCEPCLREFPHLVALQKQYGNDIVCIGLNCDYVGIKKKPPEFYHEKVTKALESMEAHIVNVLCTMPSDDLFAALKIDSIPAVFIYDRQGKRVHTFDNRTPAGDGEGISYEKQIEPAVAELVKS